MVYMLLFYITYISVDLAHHEIFCAKVGKGGIIEQMSNSASIQYPPTPPPPSDVDINHRTSIAITIPI